MRLQKGTRFRRHRIRIYRIISANAFLSHAPLDAVPSRRGLHSS